MGVPSGQMGASFDVLVQFQNDPEAQRRVMEGATTVEEELSRIEKTAQQAGEAMDKAFSKTQAGKAAKEYAKVTEEEKKAKKAADELTESQKKAATAAANSAAAQATQWNLEAQLIMRRVQQMRMQVAEMNKLSEVVGRAGAFGLTAGLGIVGGIFAAANKYVQDAEQATEVTERWQAAQDRLAESGSRIGAILAERSLPILEEVARLADKAADFVEDNPDIVSAALNTGLVLASLGAVGIAVSKGIKLYSDVQYLASVPLQMQAAQLQLAASEQQLIAAQLRAEAQGIETVEGLGEGAAGLKGLGSAGKGFMAIVTKATVLLGAFTAGLVVADKVFDALEGHDVKFKDYMVTIGQATALFAKGVGDIITEIAGWFGNNNMPDLGSQWFVKVRDALGLVEKDSEDAAEALEKIPLEDLQQAAELYAEYRADDLAMVQEHYAERRQITRDAWNAGIAANQKVASRVRDINRSMGDALEEAQAAFDREYARAEQEHALRRAEIVREGGEEIVRIEQDLQETLRKNQLEHDDRVRGLLAARDAVGLLNENKQFIQQQAEATREANIEIRRRRADIAQRLEDLDRQHAEERARRLQEYQLRVEEIRAQAAKQLQVAREQHTEEIRQIREQAAAKLREEDARFQEERRRKYDAYVAQIRDLNAAILGETELKKRGQEQQLRDLEAWAAKYRAGLLSALPEAQPVNGFAAGGYTTGLVRTGEKGYEWIANHQTTQQAESLLGARLSQDNVVAALRMARNAANMVNYNDYKRMEFPMGREQKDVYRQVAVEVLQDILSRR